MSEPRCSVCRRMCDPGQGDVVEVSLNGPPEAIDRLHAKIEHRLMYVHVQCAVSVFGGWREPV